MKKINIKVLIIGVTALLVLLLSIAFASLVRKLTVRSYASLNKTDWNIYFDNISSVNIKGQASELTTPKLANNKALITDLEVGLSVPGDSITYTVDIINDGDIDAKIDNIVTPNLTEQQDDIFELNVTYTGTNNEVQINDTLDFKETKNITIQILYKTDISKNDLPSTTQVIYTKDPKRVEIDAIKAQLPEGYTYVEYIESTGTQWIDTGISPKRTTRIIFSFSLTYINGAARNGWQSTSRTTEVYLFGYSNGNFTSRVNNNGYDAATIL